MYKVPKHATNYWGIEKVLDSHVLFWVFGYYAKLYYKVMRLHGP